MDPSNELIKEGPVQKISARNNSTSEKYLFLVGTGGRSGEQVGWGWGGDSAARLGCCCVTSAGWGQIENWGV